MSPGSATHVAHELSATLPLDANGAIPELLAVHLADDLERHFGRVRLEVAVRERSSGRAVSRSRTESAFGLPVSTFFSGERERDEIRGQKRRCKDISSPVKYDVDRTDDVLL